MSPASDEMWLEWEWHETTGATTYEAAAQTGEFVLGEFIGTPGTDGLVIPDGQGQIGGYAYARWSPTDELWISFSAACEVSEVVETIL